MMVEAEHSKIETIQPALKVATYAIEQAIRVFQMPEPTDKSGAWVEMMKAEARKRMTFEDYQYWMALVRIRDDLKGIQ